MIGAESFEWRESGPWPGWFTTDAVELESREHNERTLMQVANIDAVMRSMRSSKYRQDEYGSLYIRPWELTQKELGMLAAIEEHGVLDDYVYAEVQYTWEREEVEDWVAGETARKLGWDTLEWDLKQHEVFNNAVLKSLRNYSHWESSGLYVDTDNAGYQELVRKNTHGMWVNRKRDITPDDWRELEANE